MFGNSIRSLGGVPLGQNKSIQIVEIGHSLFVVGVGENIQLLDKIIDADEVRISRSYYNLRKMIEWDLRSIK